MEKELGSAELNVKIVERCLVSPCMPSPQDTLYLSNLDNQPILRTFTNVLLVYEACEKNLADPAKTIREALSKLLVYYYPLAGRLRKKEDGKLQVECTGEGVLFVEAMADNSLSVLGDLDYFKPSFQQLAYKVPSNTDIEELHPMVLQLLNGNYISCIYFYAFLCIFADQFIIGKSFHMWRVGGFVVAVSFYHSVCDGRGVGQFLKALGEMTRGYVIPSIKPIWDRELLKPRNLLVHDLDMIEEKIGSTSHSWTPPICEESTQMSLTLDSKTIKYMKQGIMQECTNICTTFEIVTALVWRARIKALEIPDTESVNAFFAVDVRESFNPPLPNGYYGNAFIATCAKATVHELINQPFSYIVNIIKRSKMSLTSNYLRSIIDMDQFPSDASCNQGNIGLSDWRWLGFNEVDFGSGSPVNVCPIHWDEHGLSFSNVFIFLHPSKRKVDGIRMIMWMHPKEFKVFEKEVESIINKYVTIVYSHRL